MLQDKLQQKSKYNAEWVPAFFTMEIEHDLFGVHLPDGTPLWDLARYYIDNKKRSENPNIQEKKSVLRNLKAITNISNSLFKLFFQNYENFFYVASRYSDQKNAYYDPYYLEVKDYLPGKVMTLESCNQDSYLFPPECSHYILYLSRLFKRNQLHIPKQLTCKIISAVKKHLGEGLITHEYLEDIYSEYIFDLKFYTFLFRNKKIRRVFFVQNGIQKGMIQAAKKLNIPVFEFQHGEISKYHFLYSYNENYAPADSVILPDVFFIFSNFWIKGMFIPMRCISIGNDFMYRKPQDSKEPNSIVVISSIPHENDLESLTRELASKAPNLKIYFKLHPAQYKRLHQFKKAFHQIPNVYLVSNEKSISDLIEIAPFFIIISSTTVYEALQSGKRVFVYKKKDYFTLEPCFDLSGIALFENADELLHLIQHNEQADIGKGQPIFFEPLDVSLFTKTIMEYDC